MSDRKQRSTEDEAKRRLALEALAFLSMHALRRTAASHWIAEGVDLLTVAARLGDTVETVAKTYVRAFDRVRRGERQEPGSFVRAVELGWGWRLRLKLRRWRNGQRVSQATLRCPANRLGRVADLTM